MRIVAWLVAGALLAAALPLAAPATSAPAAPPPPRVSTHDGALVAGGLGLHFVRAAPWKMGYDVPITFDADELRIDLEGLDALMGPDFWVHVVDPQGEHVARSTPWSERQSLVVGDTTLDARGEGVYRVVVECGFCAVMTYRVTITTTYAARAALLTVEDQHLAVVPGEATRTGYTLRGERAAPTLDVAGLPAGWALEAGADEIALTPPADTPAGTRVAFELLARDSDGAILDRVPMEATFTHELARLVASPYAVVALVEFGGSGINPYHEEFRAADAPTENPAYYVTGYPEDAQALPLTLDAPTYADAVAADADVWAGVRGNTLYYVPGTRIVGFVCFGACNALDTGGHGTGTASLAAGRTLGEAPDALIVSVTGDFFYGLRWAARQPWIDAISMSLGPWLGTPTVGISDPVGAGTGNPYVPFSPPWGQKLAFESGKRFFTASSQGWGAWTTAGGGASANGYCPYTMGSSFAGSPWTFAVETYWPWTELPWKTSCKPDLVAQGWDLVAASPLSLTGTNGFGHPSGATPQAAGAYVNVIQQARRALGSTQEGAVPFGIANLGDGILAVAPEGAVLPATGPLADGLLLTSEAERVFLHALEQVDTASSFLRHGDDPRWQRDAALVPAGGEYAFEGYGLLTDKARATMVAVVLGEAPEALRPDDDAARAADFAARLAFWEPHVQGQVWVF